MLQPIVMDLTSEITTYEAPAGCPAVGSRICFEGEGEYREATVMGFATDPRRGGLEVIVRWMREAFDYTKCETYVLRWDEAIPASTLVECRLNGGATARGRYRIVAEI